MNAKIWVVIFLFQIISIGAKKKKKLILFNAGLKRVFFK